MTDLTSACLGTEGGKSCTAAATITEPVPLCPRHQMQVAIAIVPAMLTAALGVPDCAELPEVHDAATVRLVSSAEPAELDLSGGHGGRVYFIRNGARVKIGYTTNLRNRVVAFGLRADSVSLLLVGDKRLEQALHRYFAHQRVANTEWFRYTPEIDAYITSKLEHRAGVQGSVTGIAAQAGRDITASRPALIEAIRTHMGERRAVHLADVLRSLHSNGAPSHWTVTTLRRACIDHEIPTRAKVRVGARVSVGVHRDDLPAD